MVSLFTWFYILDLMAFGYYEEWYSWLDIVLYSIVGRFLIKPFVPTMILSYVCQQYKNTASHNRTRNVFKTLTYSFNSLKRSSYMYTHERTHNRTNSEMKCINSRKYDTWIIQTWKRRIKLKMFTIICYLCCIFGLSRGDWSMCKEAEETDFDSVCIRIA